MTLPYSFGSATTYDKLFFAQLQADLDAIAILLPVTGRVLLTFETSAPSGWILLNDGSIGNAASNATTRNNADTLPLYTLFYNNIPALVVQDSTGTPVARGADAATDFAANRRLVIPKALGRSIAIAGAGSGLTSRTLGSTAGAETETPTIAKTASHAHAEAGGGAFLQQAGANGNWNASGINSLAGANVANTGSGTALNIVDPSTYMNALVKL